MKSNRFHFSKDDEDVFERELRLKQPKHKRLEYVAGWDIRQLVKDARKKRPKLHTREGFFLKSSVSDIGSVFSFRSRSSAKSSKYSALTTVSSIQSKKFRIYDLLKFHHVHGSNINLSSDRLTASRKSNSFCNGIVFGHRPIKFGETVHLKFNKVRSDWRGSIRVGFTPYNPDRCDVQSLPSYAVPDLTRKSRFWAIPIAERYATKHNIFSFTFKDDGSVSYMINNEGKGQFLTGLKIKITLWPLLDLYGKVEEITIIDDETAEKGSDSFLGDENSDNENFEDHEKIIARSSSYMVTFHETHGKNIRLDSQKTNAKRYDSFWNSLTFMQDPLKAVDIIFIEIVKVEANYAGGLGIGLTSVNPLDFNVEDLPDNADLIKIKPGKYWKMSRDIDTKEGDQIGFTLDTYGQLFYSHNGSPYQLLFSDVPSKEPVRLIFDIYGRTTMIKLMGKIRNHLLNESGELECYAYDDIQDNENEKECLMCFKKNRLRDCVIQPCGHTALCSWCAITCIVKQQLRFIVCPICGGPVKDVIRITKLPNENQL